MVEVPERLAAALADRYRIERRLGEGGMATVYLAEDLKHDRRVAIKVLRPELAVSLGSERFLHEIKVTANLQHPHILPLFDSGAADSFLFYVMPFVQGESLREKLDREQRLGLEESLAIARAVASALDYAHRQQIVHRDIKPENVMLSHGLPVVADFGIARAVQTAGQERLTQTGLSIGTPAYMSPEQAGAERELDGRTDVYALGCVLYELLTGETPYTGSNAQAIITKAFLAPVPSVRERRPEVPEAIAVALRRALAKDPADRFGTAAEFGAALHSGATGPVATGAVGVAASSPRREPFVGREAERAQLAGLLERARMGQGGMALLAGEPGVGKTRLASEILADGRERGLLALTGHAYEDETAPLILAAEILEEMVRLVPAADLRTMLGADASELSRLLPGLRKLYGDIPEPDDLPPEQQQRALFRSVLDCLSRASSSAPLVILVDDVHWADEANLKLLEHLAARLGELPILVLGTYRDAGPEMGAAFQRTLANLVRQRQAERLTIRSFDQQAVGALLAARGGSKPPAELVAAIHHGTEGNAFFVEEVFRHLSEEGVLFDEAGRWRAGLDREALDVPEGVRLVTGRRLGRLRENTRSVLTTAAGIGLRFDLGVLEAAVGDPDQALDGVDEAEAAQLILPSAGHREARYEFTHALVRQTLLEELSIPRLQRLHLGIANAMEAVYGDGGGEHAADIAYQLQEAGGRADAGRTRRYLTLAGKRALSAAAAEAARNYFDRALQLETGLADAERAKLLLERGNANRTRGDLEAATADWQAAVPLLEAAGLPVLAAGACWQIAWKAMLQRQLEESETYALRGLESAGDEPSVERSHLLAMLGHLESLRANFERADELLSEAVAMAEQLRDERALGVEVLFSRIYQFEHTARVSRLLETGERAIELARRGRRPWELASVIGATLMPLGWAGRFDRSEALTDEIEPVAVREGDALSIGHALAARGQVALSRGDLAEAARLCGGSTRTYREASFPWFTVPLAMEGQVALLAGDWERARDILEEAARSKLGGNFAGLEESQHALLLAYAGDPEALPLLDALEPLLPRAGVINGNGPWVVLLMWVEAAVLLDQCERAARLYPLVLELIAEGAVTLWACGLTERTAGIAAAAGKQWAVAEAHFTEALRQAEELPHVPERAQVRYWLARMLVDRAEPGDSVRAETLLREAADVCRQVGMPRHLEMVEAMRQDLRSARRGAFVGREAERSQINGMLAEAAAGRGALILLGGEPGVGKTRLASEILEDGQERGMLALTGHAYEDDTAPFILAAEILEDMVRQVPGPDLRPMLGPSASALSRLLPELRQAWPEIPAPEELPPEHQQRALFRSIFDLLQRASARTPLVLLLDDIHWADESSLKLVEYLTPRLGELPILVLATYRDAETEMGQAFARTLAALVRQRQVRRVAIKCLEEDAVRALLAQRAGSVPPAAVARAIHHGTEGNAFFVEEVFRHLSEEGALFDQRGQWREDLDAATLDVPEGVRLVTGRRLERLQEATRKVLSTAAGIGLRFDLAVLEAAVGDPEAVLDGVEEAEAAQLIGASGGRGEARYEFSHALVRQTLLEELSVPRAQRLHLAIADAMEATWGEGAAGHASDIAHQLIEAGPRADGERTRRFLRLAGEQALAAAAPDEALVALDRALGYGDQVPDQERAELHYLRGLASRTLGRHGDAAAIWTEALPLLESVRRVDLVADVCRQLAYYHLWAQDEAAGMAVTRRGLKAVGDAPGRERCRLLSIEALAHSCQIQFEEADRVTDEAIALAEQLGDHRLLGGEVLLGRLYRCEHACRAGDLVETGSRAIDLVRQHGSAWEQTSTIGTTLLGCFWAGDFPAVRERVAQAMPLAEREGNVGTLVHCLVSSTLEALTADHLESAIEWATRTIGLGEQYQMPWCNLAYTYRGVAHLWSNRWVEATSDFEHGVAAQLMAKTHFGIEAAGALYGFAMMGSERAGELYHSDYPLPALDRDSPEGAWQWCMARVQAAMLLGRMEDAGQWLPHLEKLMGQGTKVSLGLGLTAKFAGLAAAARNDRVAMERHFETAIRQADELPYHTEQAETRRWYAWALERFGRGEDQRRIAELRTAAAAKYRELGGWQPTA